MSTQERIKISSCQKCGKTCTVIAYDAVDKKSQKEFVKEVVDHDLKVETLSIEEYRNKVHNLEFGCKC